MNVLITGSNGLLGQNLVKQLQEKKVDFLATSKGENRISTLNPSNYQQLDITNQEEVESVFNTCRPTVVINTAAMTNVDACESHKEACWDMNVNAIQYLIEACQKHKTHLIHLSTDFVFDGESGPYKETDIPNPLSYYGKSKYEAEKLIQNSQLEKWSIARTIIVYGVVEKMSRSNVVLWAKSALEKGEPINVVEDQFRSPTHGSDLAKGCLLIAEKKASGIFHLSGKEIISILELVERVADYYQLDKSIISPIKSETLNQAAKRPPVTGFDLSKSKKELGYNPISFEAGLALVTQELAKHQ
jgi:dTDP-4-dehydrorhamnose reductase